MSINQMEGPIARTLLLVSLRKIVKLQLDADADAGAGASPAKNHYPKQQPNTRNICAVFQPATLGVTISTRLAN